MDQARESTDSRTAIRETVETLASELIERGLRMATAESCTGGLIGALLTNIPGSSAWYQGGVISYANEAKVELLGVSPLILEQVGAVSEETAISMAAGVRQRLSTDLSVSVTGIAGPGGGSAAEPVGTVWIGIDSAKGSYARRFHFEGGREAVRAATVAQALTQLMEAVNDLGAPGTDANVDVGRMRD